MPTYPKGLLDDIETLLYGMRSLKPAERQRLRTELNRRKLGGCPIGDDHVSTVIKKGLGSELKPKEDAYIEHALTCPVCFIISQLVLAELETGWTLDEFRRTAILHLRELKEKQ